MFGIATSQRRHYLAATLIGTPTNHSYNLLPSNVTQLLYLQLPQFYSASSIGYPSKCEEDLSYQDILRENECRYFNTCAANRAALKAPYVYYANIVSVSPQPITLWEILFTPSADILYMLHTRFLRPPLVTEQTLSLNNIMQLGNFNASLTLESSQLWRTEGRKSWCVGVAVTSRKEEFTLQSSQ